MRIIIGSFGSDAGYWIIDDTGAHHVGGWGVDAMSEFRSAVRIIGEATQLKTPGLREAAIKSVQGFAQEQLAKYVKDGAGSVVIMLA